MLHLMWPHQYFQKKSIIILLCIPSASVTSKESYSRAPEKDTDSLSSLEMGGSNHSGSTGTPQGTPKFRRPSFLQQRDRLYRAGPGMYVAIQDVESQQEGDLSLKKGMAIEGVYLC